MVGRWKFDSACHHQAVFFSPHILDVALKDLVVLFCKSIVVVVFKVGVENLVDSAAGDRRVGNIVDDLSFGRRSINNELHRHFDFCTPSDVSEFHFVI